jgi:hypothetical protein
MPLVVSEGPPTLPGLTTKKFAGMLAAARLVSKSPGLPTSVPAKPTGPALFGESVLTKAAFVKNALV